MDFYKRKQTWKYILFSGAIVISSLSIYLTKDLEISLDKTINSLSQSIETLKQNEETLKREEDENMRNFARAIQHLNNMDPNIEGDFSFSMEIIKQNTIIPLILIDECNDILQNRNLNIPKKFKDNILKKKEYILRELDTMRTLGDSILINVLGEDQKLFYRNSKILEQTTKMHLFTLEKQTFTKKILKKCDYILSIN